MASQNEVIICGSGSAGLCAATWLARTGIRCLILESRKGPMKMGQADGVQCRTVEVYDSFGVADEILREGHHQHEVTFWGESEDRGIARTGRMADTPPGISHQPHLLLNQARMNEVLIQAMERFNGQTIEYGYEVYDVEVNAASDSDDYRATVKAKKDGASMIFRAKYVLVSTSSHRTLA
jgi:phenol 2-monooxygenase (NADPH)